MLTSSVQVTRYFVTPTNLTFYSLLLIGYAWKKLDQIAKYIRNYLNVKLSPVQGFIMCH